LMSATLTGISKPKNTKPPRFTLLNLKVPPKYLLVGSSSISHMVSLSKQAMYVVPTTRDPNRVKDLIYLRNQAG
jgi:hypothetical protein